MTKFVKNTLLNYLPRNFEIEYEINLARIYDINKKTTKGNYVIYLCERELRAKDNFALQFAIQKSCEFNVPLKIIHPRIIYSHKPKQEFIDRQIDQVKDNFDKLNLDFEIIPQTQIILIKRLNPLVLILDFNPILKRNYLKDLSCKIYEIDGHNIVPARFVSDKQEYSAATFRPKIYRNIYGFLTEYKNLTEEKVEADYILEDFIRNKLQYYSEFRNHPDKNITSGLSKYLNLGFISSERVAIEVLKSYSLDENKEVFLEELIIRKELAENFCFYAKNFKSFSDISNWAKITLNEHKIDLRTYIYSINEIEKAQTHDKLWNATQNQLIKDGTINSYLRMYWVKKISEWTISSQEALKIAIYLNDKYAYDSPSSNGYVGILWGIGGLHDRAFQNYPVTGKIRRMTYKSIKKKYNLTQYINMYA